MAENTWRLQVAPERTQPTEPQREFDVVEGRLDLATRVVRFMGSTLLVTLIIGLVGALVLHATIIENQRDLDERRAEITRLAAETETMRNELAELEAPERIVKEALRIGMIEAPEIEYLAAPSAEVDDRTMNVTTNQLLVRE